MIRRLDIYMAFAFLGPFLICFLALTGLMVVFDAFAKLDDFIELGLKDLARVMGRYYLLFIPIKMSQLLPAVTLMGAGLGLVRLAKFNELTAMKACGISLYRIVMPMFILAVLLGFASRWNQERLIPRIAEEMERLSRTVEHKDVVTNIAGDSPTLDMFRIYEYNMLDHSMKGISALQLWKDQPVRTKKRQIFAESGTWVGRDWDLRDVTIRDFDREGRPDGPPKKPAQYIVEADLTPEDLKLMPVDPGLMSSDGLKALIRKEPTNLKYRVLLHGRAVQPLVGVVLLLIGIPFIVGYETLSHSRFLGLLACIVVCGVFWTLTFLCNSLGTSGYCPPALAAWLPVMLFGAVGLLLFDAAKT
ncbi:MAG: YjgP/YjgQ family permease [Planctomycetes bacterium]|nr:YjgP/YjgQ family permease [Planctomycetota bacterium]